MAITAIVVAAVGRDPAVAAILQSLSISVAIAGMFWKRLHSQPFGRLLGCPAVLVSITVALVAAISWSLSRGRARESKVSLGS
jgi:hypothetical protein